MPAYGLSQDMSLWMSIRGWITSVLVQPTV
jgi:hypothetical protein